MQYRHGDLLLKVVDSIPEGAERATHNILAEGEATGHAHRLVEGLLYEKDGKLYFNSAGKAHVTHEEHKRIDFPAGNYEVVRQVEYVPQAIPRMVAD